MDLRELTQLQRELVKSAIGSLNDGGILGYATCSPHLAETTVQVHDILKHYPQMELVDLAPYLPETLTDATRDCAMALWTHRHGTDAMYLVVLRKKS